MSHHTIPVLLKAISVLKLIAEGRQLTTTKSLEHTLGISHSTAYRILQTFEREDWIRAVDNGRFEISYGLLPLLEPLVRHELLIETVRGPMLELSRATGLTTKVSVRQGDFAVTIFRTESPRPTSVNVKIGSAFHLALGSSGAVLLAALPAEDRARIVESAPDDCWQHQRRTDVSKRVNECLRNGICVDPGEFRPTTFAISAPVRDAKSNVIAAITAIGFPKDFEGVKLRQIRRELLACAVQCSALSHQPGYGAQRATG